MDHIIVLLFYFFFLLSFQSKVFSKTANQVKRKTQWENLRLKVILGVIVGVIVLVIIIVPVVISSYNNTSV